MAPNALPRPNELVDPGTPDTLSADASPGRSTAGLTMIPLQAGRPIGPVPASPASVQSGWWAWAGPSWRSSSSAATESVEASLPSPTALVP